MDKTQEFAQLLTTLTPDDLVKVFNILEQLHRRTERQKEAIKQAVAYAMYDDMIRGQLIVNGINESPNVLVGIAFAAGVAEGKQRERNRRHLAAIKKAIRETGNVPRKYME